MARAQTAQALIQTLPEGQREVAQRIIDALPQAQRAEGARIIAQLSERYGAKASDALMHLESIVTSGNFRASHLGTVSLLINRSGGNAAEALREFGIIVNHEKFNRYVHETVRLTATRAGEDTFEALRALHFLLSNPSFTQLSLNMALPDTFVRFLDSAIRNGGDLDYLAIRAMGSMFANSHFGPEQFNARFASNFGTMVRTVREIAAPPNQLYGLQSLCILLGNGSVSPAEMTPEYVQFLSRTVVQIIEYTRAHEGGGEGVKSPIDDAMRVFNLILGNRQFRLDMLSESGMLGMALSSTAGSPLETLNPFLQFLRSCREHPNALAAATRLIETDHVPPSLAITVMNSMLSNPSLAALADREDFYQRISALFSILPNSPNLSESFSSFLGESEEINRISASIVAAAGVQTPESILLSAPRPLWGHPALSLFCRLLSDQRMTPEIFERIESTLMSSPPNSQDIAVLFLTQLFSNRSFRPQMLTAGFLSDLASLAGRASSQGINHRLLAHLFSARHFTPSMIRPDGIISHVAGARGEDAALTAFRGILDNRRLTPELETLIRQVYSIPGSSGLGAITRLNAVLTRFDRIQPRHYPFLTELVRGTGIFAEHALSVYIVLLDNPNFRRLMISSEFITRLSGTITRIGRQSGARVNETLMEFARVLENRHFTPAMLEQLELISRICGSSANFVYGYINALASQEGVRFSRIMEPEFIRFLYQLGLVVSRYGGRDPARAHAAVNELLSDMKGDAFRLLEHSDDIFAYIRALAENAGPMASLALTSVIPRVQHIDLDADDAATLGRWMRRYFESIPEDQRADATSAVGNMLAAITHNSDLYDILFDNPELYERGRRLAESVITDRPITPDVALNFAYGIERIGEARVRALHRAYGLRYFARYSDGMLERLYANRERAADPSRPTVFVAFPFHDDNGAFYREGTQLDDLLDTHNVVIFESGSEEGFYAAARDFGRRYGRTRDIIIGGHGSPASIRLGSEMEPGMLDMTDTEELAQLRSLLGRDPRIILVSCSTGQSETAIGGVISRILGGTLIAPRTPSSTSGYDVDSHGRITVEYREERGFFFEGLDVSTGRRAP
jgi:hypothetical protein